MHVFQASASILSFTFIHVKNIYLIIKKFWESCTVSEDIELSCILFHLYVSCALYSSLFLFILLVPFWFSIFFPFSFCLILFFFLSLLSLSQCPSLFISFCNLCFLSSSPPHYHLSLVYFISSFSFPSFLFSHLFLHFSLSLSLSYSLACACMYVCTCLCGCMLTYFCFCCSYPNLSFYLLFFIIMKGKDVYAERSLIET